MELSGKHLMRLLAMLASISSLAALPTPHFSGAQPQMVYPGTPDFTDTNGRVAVYVQGSNLSPDSDLGHPSGWDGGYQHVLIRRISPNNVADGWVKCEDANGCITYGGAAQSVLILGLDPNRYLGERASHVQVRMWVSMFATSADEPTQVDGGAASDWSNIWTIDSAAPGASKPVPVQPPAKPPTIARISPTEILIGDPKADYRIRIYGHLCGDKRVVLFNGDRSAAATPEETNCRGYDDNNAPLGDLSLVHVTIPERFRLHSVGTVDVVVQDAAGVSNTVKIAFKPMYVRAANLEQQASMLRTIAAPDNTQTSVGIKLNNNPPPMVRPKPKLPESPKEQLEH